MKQRLSRAQETSSDKRSHGSRGSPAEFKECWTAQSRLEAALEIWKTSRADSITVGELRVCLSGI